MFLSTLHSNIQMACNDSNPKTSLQQKMISMTHHFLNERKAKKEKKKRNKN